jgi:hypothetical protein
LTPVRRLEGITYWVIDDPTEIGDFLGLVLRKEWEADLADGDKPPADWLSDLLGRKWTLQVASTAEVRGSAYLHAEELGRRRAELRRGIEKFGEVIWPIVVRQEDYFLADGYCRYTTLKEMGVPRLYAYVGSKN